MSPPLLGVEDERRSEVFSLPISRNSLGLRERNYLGLSDSSSSVDSSAEDGKNNLNLKATELRLGLPGSQSPQRETELCMRNSGTQDEKPLFPLLPSRDGIALLPQKGVVSGSKRGFYDAMEGFSQQSAGINVMLSTRASGAQAVAKKDAPSTAPREQPRSVVAPNINSSQPSAKAQVVGWPPVRSYRTKTLATTSKSNDEVDGKPGLDPIFVKVSMDGAPFLRKVDLRTYSTYAELCSALEKMFSGFTIGRCKSQGTSGKELCENKLKDLLHGSEYVVTYEDKDGDWMLVGDVPWEMFIDTCKKLKIMKSSDAIGLAPRAMEKSKCRN